MRTRPGAVIPALTGHQGPQIIADSFTYASSIDEISDLYAAYAYKVGSPRPLVVLMHGFTGDATDVTDAILQDMAVAGFFALAVGMRGRNGAGGTPDVNARELQDIVDAVEHVLAEFAAVIDPASINVVGYSGGGGNVIGLACRYPDMFQVYAAHFPISDYGFDETFSWGDQEGATRQTQLAAWIGYKARSGWSGAADVSLDHYQARDSLQAIAKNLLGGHLYVFHDDADSVVDVTQSQRVVAAFSGESNSRITYDETDSGDSPRWLHDLPHPRGDPIEVSGAPVRFTRSTWGAAIKAGTHAPWTVPETGSMRILGALATKRFSIWLNDGQDAVADVDYDTTTGLYTVDPLTATPMTVHIVQGENEITVEISGETEIDVSPLVYDTFTGTNGTSLASHEPEIDQVGGGWASIWGGWEIQSNHAAWTSSSNPNSSSSALIDCGEAEHEITCRVRTASSGVTMVAVRAADPDNKFEVGIATDLNSCVIIERTSASATIRAQVAHSYSANTEYTIEVTTTSAGISASVGGVAINYTSTSKNTNTLVGIAAPNNHASVGSTARWWDDFIVRRPST